MVAAATGLLIVTIALSRVLGFVRESLLMAYFGQGALTDVYKQSFIIPDTLYFLIAGGALSSAFIPVFTKYIAHGKDEEAWKTFSVVGTLAFVVTGTFVVLGEIFAVPLSRIASPGFIDEQVLQMARLTRIVLPAQMFFFMGGLMMGCLYSKNKFLAPAFGPLIYTLGIISGGLISAYTHPEALKFVHSPEIVHAMRVWSDPQSTVAMKEAVQPLVEETLRVATPAVSGYSWGALIGAFLGNFCLQLFAVRKIGMNYRPSLQITHEGARKVFVLMLPVLLGLSLPQVDVQLNKYFATLLNAGSVTALDNANRLMQVPYGILGTSFAIALFPTLSALAAKRLWGDYRRQISNGVRRVVFVALPASVLLMVLSVPAVRFVFQHGKLVTGQDVNVTALTLVLFSAGIFGWCMQAVVARAFYALHDTVTVVVTGTIMTALFIAMSVGFVKALHEPKLVWWAPAGLALITSFSAVTHAVVLLAILRKRIGGIHGRQMARTFGKMFVSGAAMALVTYPIYYLIEFRSPLTAIMRNAQAGGLIRVAATGVEILVVSVIGIAVYAFVARLLKMEELEHASRMFTSKFSRRAARKTT